MAITGLSNQQLLMLIIFVGMGAFVFVAIFFTMSAIYLRKRRQKKPDATGNNPKIPREPVLHAASGGQKQAMGSLLKSTGNNLPQGEGQNRPTTAAAEPLVLQEAIRVLVNPKTQEVIIDVDGQRFSQIAEVKDKMVGRRILESVAALLKFTGGLIATAAGIKSMPVPDVRLTAWPVAPAPAPSAPVVAEDPAPVPPPPDVAPEREVGQAFLSQLESKTESMRRSSAAAPPKSKGFFGRRKKVDPEPEPEMTSFNLAEQIDEILQQKLAQNGIAVKAKIHSGLGGAIRIQVGSEFYDAMDEVTDAQIKALIKEAIAEWNR